jgi:molecular chaperone DnaK
MPQAIASSADTQEASDHPGEGGALAEIAIGIDLGTSNSCVAVMRDGAARVLPNAQGEATTASVIAVREDGSIVVGNLAKANIIHDAKHTICSAKRLIGRSFHSPEVKKAKAISAYEIVPAENQGLRIQVRREVFSIPEISAMILRELKAIAEMRLGQPVHKAVITVPANFNDNQRQATKDAGRIAGLDVLRMLNEPTAAALAYGFGRGLSQKIAVYDLGGGTFDISVLEIGQDVFEVLSTCGDTFLGGDDFDDRLIDLLAEEFLARHGTNLRHDPHALEKLKDSAERAKKALSVADEVEVRIPAVATAADGTPLSIERRLTLQDLAVLVQDLMLRTFKVCDEALQQAGVVARDLDGVILVGGPTRLPFVRAAVRDYFEQEPKAGVDPDQVVALGAAIHASTLVDSRPGAYLLDVTPLSLRIGLAGGLAETVIERNTPVPIEQTRAFTTTQDGQEKVRIRVYQGESRTAAENELLGEFEFGGFRKAARGQVTIDVTFEINADGIVHVTASDRETGAQSSTRIALSSGLSEGELEHILDEKRTERVRTEPIAAGREVIGAVRLVTTPVRSVPEARPRPAAATPEATTAEIPVLASRPAARAPARPAAAVPGDFGEDDLLEIELELDAERAPAPLHAPVSDDEDLIDASLDASVGLFDDGDDAPELTEEEASLLDSTADPSFFETPGVDLSDAAPEDEEPG